MNGGHGAFRTAWVAWGVARLRSPPSDESVDSWIVVRAYFRSWGEAQTFRDRQKRGCWWGAPVWWPAPVQIQAPWDPALSMSEQLEQLVP